jgi:tripartite-type tricarboxylate transporter receptor subunit TctC
MQQAGVKDYQFTQWLALLAPANTPRDIVGRINGALRAALTSKEMSDKFNQQGFDAYLTTPEEAGRFIASEVQRFGKVIKARKITAE